VPPSVCPPSLSLCLCLSASTRLRGCCGSTGRRLVTVRRSCCHFQTLTAIHHIVVVIIRRSSEAAFHVSFGGCNHLPVISPSCRTPALETEIRNTDAADADGAAPSPVAARPGPDVRTNIIDTRLSCWATTLAEFQFFRTKLFRAHTLTVKCLSQLRLCQRILQRRLIWPTS